MKARHFTSSCPWLIRCYFLALASSRSTVFLTTAGTCSSQKRNWRPAANFCANAAGLPQGLPSILSIQRPTCVLTASIRTRNPPDLLSIYYTDILVQSIISLCLYHTTKGVLSDALKTARLVHLVNKQRIEEAEWLELKRGGRKGAPLISSVWFVIIMGACFFSVSCYEAT